MALIFQELNEIIMMLIINALSHTNLQENYYRLSIPKINKYKTIKSFAALLEDMIVRLVNYLFGYLIVAKTNFIPFRIGGEGRVCQE